MSGSEGRPTTGAPDPVECAEALRRLFEFLDQEIDESNGDRVRQHLADCEPCLRAYGIEEQVRTIVRRSCTESAPAELHLRIRERLVVLRSEPTT